MTPPDGMPQGQSAVIDYRKGSEDQRINEVCFCDIVFKNMSLQAPWASDIPSSHSLKPTIRNKQGQGHMQSYVLLNIKKKIQIKNRN